MKITKYVFRHIVLVVWITTLSAAAQAQLPTNVTLGDEWKFALGYQSDAMLPGFDDAAWEVVEVPHDWAIGMDFIPDGDGNTGKLPWKNEAWYRKWLTLPDNSKDKKFYLLFDGIMAFPEVFINGRLAGKWDYGYNSFYLDITSFLNHSEKNLLAVHVDTRQQKSRWYPGAGIIRKVQLLVRNPVHVDVWGVSLSTPVIKPHYAELRADVRINGSDGKNAGISLKHSVYSPTGKLLVSKVIENAVFNNNKHISEASLLLSNPRRWDVDNPVLYRHVVEIMQDGKVIDRVENTFGVRELRFTADDGLHLNGKRIQLKGVNLHHDHGPLGAVFNVHAMKRQLRIMKDMGANAIRTSHNMPAPELPQLCDEMGLLLFNEAFDKYDSTAGITDTTDFELFVERNIRNFVRRDINHPSVFLWSAGNEIPDVQWNQNRGFDRLHAVVNAFKKYDPSRPVTLVCDSYESASLRHFDFYDVHSWNYGRRYRLARQMEPNKAVIISESASTVSTRGYYDSKLPGKPTDFTNELQVSSYDLNAPEWAELADDDFMWQQEEPYVAGEFVWTGFDYLGEPTPYTNQWAATNGFTDKQAARSSYFGIVDLCGIPKDRYYLYKSHWKPDETTIHILPHWNWEGHEGGVVPVFVYTNGDCAELFVNGQSQGKKCKNPLAAKSVDRFRLMWPDVVYQPGVIKVLAWKEGELIGEESVQTAAAPATLYLSADKSKLQPGGDDLCYVTIQAVDKQGRPCPLAMNTLKIEVEGEGQLAGVCNGDPQSLVSFRSMNYPLFYGKAVVVLRAGQKQGTLSLKVSAEGMKPAKLDIQLSSQ